MLLGEFSGRNGFLGTRGSLMLDVVFLAMILVVPLLWWSVQQARRGRYRLHKRIQVALAAVLLVAVTAFEIDMRFFTDWRERAAPSPYYSESGGSPVWWSLLVHLGFAIPTLLLWIGVVTGALRRFSTPPAPGGHSPTHRRYGKLAGGGMVLTAVTGWIFYWLAFIAT